MFASYVITLFTCPRSLNSCFGEYSLVNMKFDEYLCLRGQGVVLDSFVHIYSNSILLIIRVVQPYILFVFPYTVSEVSSEEQ